MNVTKLLAVLATTVSFSISMPAMANEFPEFPFLVVAGTATSEVPPDKAVLTLTVSAFDAESEVAVATVHRQLVELLEILAEFSIPNDAITSFNLVKEIERERKDRIEMEIVGYFISRRVAVKLEDISIFADLVASIAKLDNVSNLNAKFDVHDRDLLERALMQEANADARRTAENMLVGSSRRLGAVYAVAERSVHGSLASFSLDSNMGYPVAMARMNIAGYAETVFQPSTIELHQTVNIVFQIE